jgi:hypothetical protein
MAFVTSQTSTGGSSSLNPLSVQPAGAPWMVGPGSLGAMRDHRLQPRCPARRNPGSNAGGDDE